MNIVERILSNHNFKIKKNYSMTLELSFKDSMSVFEAVKNLNTQYPGKQLLYKLFAQKQGNRVPVGRVAGIDTDGILYIGQTSRFIRIKELFQSFQKAPSKKLFKHGADEIYWQCEKVREVYPIEDMAVEITICDDSKALEIDEITRYYRKFGEVPPFNGAIVKSKPL